MKRVGMAAIAALAAATCFGQSGRTYSSPAGFGNILYPGTGHAPNANPGGPPPGFTHRAGSGFYPARAPGAAHPGHGRSTIVPYPVIVGGYGYGGYGYGYDAPPQGYQEAAPPLVNSNSAPSVVINQTFIPERAVPVVREYGNAPEASEPQQQSGMRLYEGLKTPPQVREQNVRRASDEPTLYLIALKDHSIVQALGYWVEGPNLHYVSAEHTLNQASLDLVDRELSQRLNDERNVEFRLPKAQ